MIWARAAIGAVIVIGALAPNVVQAQFGFPDSPPPYRPAKDAKDLRSVLFNWTWYMGMLRGLDEHELITSLEYQGKGTLQVDGQPCTLTRYRISTNYQYPGQRVQYTCTRPNGQTVSNIEVVHGHYAWNEDIAGAEIVPGKGKATPMRDAVEERLIRLWSSPQGAPKAAIASVEGVAPETKLGANPGTLLKDGVDKAGQTSLAWENGKAVVTYPIPGVPGAIATAGSDPCGSRPHGCPGDADGSDSFRRHAAHAGRAPGLVGQLELRRHELALRESPLRPDAAGGLLAGSQSDHGFRVRSAFAVRAESPHVQTRVLGQNPGTRRVDKQG
jgi:hypothetical protein